MAAAYSMDLRERAVRAYEAGEGTVEEVSRRFSVGTRTLERWLIRLRETGSVAPAPKRGGWKSPVDMKLLQEVVDRNPDSVCDELLREYLMRARPECRISRSGLARALHRQGYVFKKNVRVRQSTIGPTFARNGRNLRTGWRR
jgi:transposase